MIVFWNIEQYLFELLNLIIRIIHQSSFSIKLYMERKQNRDCNFATFFFHPSLTFLRCDIFYRNWWISLCLAKTIDSNLWTCWSLGIYARCLHSKQKHTTNVMWKEILPATCCYIVCCTVHYGRWDNTVIHFR